MVDWVRHGLLFQRSSYVCISLEGLGSKKSSSMNFMIYLKMDVVSEWIGDEVVFRLGMAWNR